MRALVPPKRRPLAVQGGGDLEAEGSIQRQDEELNEHPTRSFGGVLGSPLTLPTKGGLLWRGATARSSLPFASEVTATG